MALFLLLLLALLSSSSAFTQEHLLIGAWSEPPNFEFTSYKEMADAGFNLVLGGFFANTTSTVKQQLAVCEQVGVQALVGGYNIFDPNELMPCEGPACLGYFVHDEPTEAEFSSMASYVALIRKLKGSTPLSFVNMLPNNCCGITNYTAFVEAFIQLVNPDILCFDHYPDFNNATLVTQWIENLDTISSLARQHDLHFWNFFASMPFLNIPSPSLGQLRWQAMMSLAYGSKGLLYFCYWNPYRPDLFGPVVGDLDGAIIRNDGSATYLYGYSQMVNIQAKSYEVDLVISISSTETPSLLLTGQLVSDLTAGYSYVVTFFQPLSDGRTPVLLVNNDFDNTIWPSISFASSVSSVEEVDPFGGTPQPLQSASPLLPGLYLSFDVGDAKLLLLQQ